MSQWRYNNGINVDMYRIKKQREESKKGESGYISEGESKRKMKVASWTQQFESKKRLVALIYPCTARIIKVSGATARWPFTDSAVPSSLFLLLLLRSAGLQPADLLLILLFLPHYYCYYYYYYYQSIGAIIIIIKHLVCEIYSYPIYQ